jgi:alkylation response protein AidB-like acyl-CoA dehydrogenase
MNYAIDCNLARRHYADEWLEVAQWYRGFALEVIGNPDAVLQHLDHPIVLKKIEAEFVASTRDRAVMFEAMAYGDPSFLLTTPGPSLSGVLLKELGTPEQQQSFQRYILQQRARAFFAVTEPNKGSDAANLESRLHADGTLTGEKLLFGNGAVAPIGTVLVRLGNGLLDMAALLLTPELLASSAVSRETLRQFAMHGAQLAHLRFERLPVPPELVLGRHLRATERGLLGMLKTFHQFRPGVSAMAIGHGQAMVDYALRWFGVHDSALREMLEEADERLARARALNLAAADAVDRDPLQGAFVSLAKSVATQTAEDIALELRRRLPVSGLLEHAWLSKSLADVYAYEYMEGTTPIQMNNVLKGYERGELASESSLTFRNGAR